MPQWFEDPAPRAEDTTETAGAECRTAEDRPAARRLKDAVRGGGLKKVPSVDTDNHLSVILLGLAEINVPRSQVDNIATRSTRSMLKLPAREQATAQTRHKMRIRRPVPEGVHRVLQPAPSGNWSRDASLADRLIE